MVKSYTQIIVNEGTTLTFGKHRGETVRQILKNDPSYILWLNDEEVCMVPDEIVDKAYDNSMSGDFDHNYSSYYDD